MKVYVVLMRRWGDIETHSYVKGICSSLDSAREMGVSEEHYRGGKYVAFIEEHILDAVNSQYSICTHYTGEFKDFPASPPKCIL